jgi:hypothetical protein
VRTQPQPPPLRGLSRPFRRVSGEFPRLLIIAQIPCPEEPIPLIRIGLIGRAVGETAGCPLGAGFVPPRRFTPNQLI